MNIEHICIKNEGFVYCKSSFYTAQDGLSLDRSYTFATGINRLVGEIDSGIWAASYLLSMYKYRPEDFMLFEKAIAQVNGVNMTLQEISKHSCYMDKLYPLFSTNITVNELVKQGLNSNCQALNTHQIRDMFCIDIDRFNRPLTRVGNEIFKAMAAIGYSYKKQIFCFPWISKNRFDNFHNNLSSLLDMLSNLGTIVIIPTGK